MLGILPTTDSIGAGFELPALRLLGKLLYVFELLLWCLTKKKKYKNLYFFESALTQVTQT